MNEQLLARTARRLALCALAALAGCGARTDLGAPEEEGSVTTPGVAVPLEPRRLALGYQHSYLGSPVAPSRLGPVAEIALGKSHSCARTRDERLLCWGWNDLGQLGDGTTINRFEPTAVKSAVK